MFGERNVFRNHKSLVSNADAVEPRIFGSYHTLRGAWNAREMGVYPRIRCAALSWLSASLMYTSDCRILSRLTLLTKRNKREVELVSAKPLKPREMHFSKNKEQKETEE